MQWLDDPHATYVLAAYGIAGGGLLLLLIFSWRSWHVRKAEWQKLQKKPASK